MQRDPAGIVIDHISLGVSNLQRSTIFYDAVLSALGIVRIRQTFRTVGYARNDLDDFYIVLDEEQKPRSSAKTHVAFLAPNRLAVDKFHAAALSVGATDDGAPGLRPNYHPNYYAAFVKDLDGNRIEAVCHAEV